MSTEIQRNFLEVITSYESDLQDGTGNLLDITVRAIDDFKHYCDKGGLIERKVPDNIRAHFYTRFAAALTQYFIKHDTLLVKDGLEKLAFRKQGIANIFAASGYRDMSHLVSLMTKDNGVGKRNISSAKAILLLTVLGINDVTDELMTLSLGQKPDLLFPLMLGWLNQRAVLTEQGERNRTRLLTAGSLIESISISDRHVQQMVHPWMYCSYASTPNKHDIKESFNKLFLKLLKDEGVKPIPVTYKTKIRPRVLVIHERFNSQHAMHRCYAPLIRTLRPYFETMALADEAEIDSASVAIFDQVHSFHTKKMTIVDIVNQVQAFQPDIIYYPSIGMQPWTVLISNLRLAPIQVASQGHPATTRSPEIDYVYISRIEGNLSNVYSENVLIGSCNDIFEGHQHLPEILPSKTRNDSEYVHIAVNSKVMKLSYRLLNICKRLIKEANYPLKFHFFPGERGLYFDGISEMIKSQIPDARVLGYLNYPDFLQEMKNCDLSFAAFPFGNTNGTVDACLLGIPTVAHFGAELAAQTDKQVIEMSGYPLWLVNDSDESYFETALRLINNKEERERLVSNLPQEMVRNRLLCGKNQESESPFGKMLDYVYRNNKEIQATDVRVIHFEHIFEMNL